MAPGSRILVVYPRAAGNSWDLPTFWWTAIGEVGLYQQLQCQEGGGARTPSQCPLGKMQMGLKLVAVPPDDLRMLSACEFHTSPGLLPVSGTGASP